MIVGTASNHDVCPCLVLLKRDRKPFPYPPASQPTPPLPARTHPPTPPSTPPPTPQPTPCWFLGPGADRNYWLNLCSSDSSTHRGWLTPSAPEWGELHEPDKNNTKQTNQKKKETTTLFVRCCAARATSTCLRFLICKWNRLWPLSLACRMRTVRAARGGRGFVAFITVGVVQALEPTRKPHWPFLFI